MAGWKVWGELRRRPHIELVWAYLKGHKGRIDVVDETRRRITIEASLRQRDRRAVLAHELVHDERNIFYTTSTPTALVAKEEAYVVDETARRLVPLDELDTLVRIAIVSDESVSWREVAEWFDVPRDVAERAMELLLQRSRRRHPTAGCGHVVAIRDSDDSFPQDGADTS